MDTIEMLEAIGGDASLRYASPGELANALEYSQVSEALTLAVLSGDNTPLFAELGFKAMWAPQVAQI